MIRVLIADDSPTARALLCAILGSDPDIQVVGEARDGAEAVELTQKLRPSVVTMDIRMPRMDGFEATKEIMITAPTPIVIVTASSAVQEVEASMYALRAGALAILANPHTVYLAPDDRHLGVSGRVTVSLSGAPPVGGFRPSGTFLFEAAARVFGASAVAVILTGMGDDGVAGLRAVREAGGRVIAQDEKSSVIFGMPGAAVAAGVADAVLPLDLIPTRL